MHYEANVPLDGAPTRPNAQHNYGDDAPTFENRGFDPQQPHDDDVMNDMPNPNFGPTGIGHEAPEADMNAHPTVVPIHGMVDYLSRLVQKLFDHSSSLEERYNLQLRTQSKHRGYLKYLVYWQIHKQAFDLIMEDFVRAVGSQENADCYKLTSGDSTCTPDSNRLFDAFLGRVDAGDDNIQDEFSQGVYDMFHARKPLKKLLTEMYGEDLLPNPFGNATSRTLIREAAEKRQLTYAYWCYSLVMVHWTSFYSQRLSYNFVALSEVFRAFEKNNLEIAFFVKLRQPWSTHKALMLNPDHTTHDDLYVNFRQALATQADMPAEVRELLQDKIVVISEVMVHYALIEDMSRLVKSLRYTGVDNDFNHTDFHHLATRLKYNKHQKQAADAEDPLPLINFAKLHQFLTRPESLLIPEDINVETGIINHTLLCSSLKRRFIEKFFDSHPEYSDFHIETATTYHWTSYLFATADRRPIFPFPRHVEHAQSPLIVTQVDTEHYFDDHNHKAYYAELWLQFYFFTLCEDWLDDIRDHQKMDDMNLTMDSVHRCLNNFNFIQTFRENLCGKGWENLPGVGHVYALIKYITQQGVIDFLNFTLASADCRFNSDYPHLADEGHCELEQPYLLDSNISNIDGTFVNDNALYAENGTERSIRDQRDWLRRLLQQHTSDASAPGNNRDGSQRGLVWRPKEDDRDKAVKFKETIQALIATRIRLFHDKEQQFAREQAAAEARQKQREENEAREAQYHANHQAPEAAEAQRSGCVLL